LRFCQAHHRAAAFAAFSLLLTAATREGTTMKIFVAAAIAVLLSSGVTFAQDGSSNSGTNNATTGSGATTGSNNDSGGNYLTGPNLQRFYTDDSMTTLRSDADVKSAWEAMSEQDRENAKQSCAGNKDNRWSAFCNSIGSM
jgi:hypothetical protein